MDTTLTRQDLDTLLGAVRRFATQSVAPLVQRHDVPLQPAQIERLTREAETLGLLNLAAEPGLGLWDAPAVEFSVNALALLAEANAGLAWHLSQLAFGRRLAQRLGLAGLAARGRALANVQGFYGLARTALPRYLRGVALDDEDRALLADYFTPAWEGARLLLHAVDGWETLLAPAFTGEQIAWRVLPRDALACEPQPHTHGLDEIPCIAWRPVAGAGEPAVLDPAASRAIYAEALQVQSLALMATGLGSVRRAYRIARDYAAIRRQGGTTIDRLPAVQHMLAGIRSTLDVCTALLAQLALHPLALERTAEVLAVRSRVAPLLCQAASEAMQAMGGIGYMRDTGVEKVLRDVNQLRLMGGTPGELQLFVAEWERLR